MTQEWQTIYVAGHRGMVGSAIVRTLLASGVPAKDILTRTHAGWTCATRPLCRLFSAAAPHVGVPCSGQRGRHPRQQHLSGGLYLRQPDGASQCDSREPDAIAKIAGIKMFKSYNRQYGRDYRSVMPTNLYGPGGNYHPENSHVIPALLRRFHEAKLSGAPEVAIWGSGAPRREFLCVDDMAAASVFVRNLQPLEYQTQTSPMQSHLNGGFGSDVTIAELARAVGEAVGYGGVIIFDTSKPDGAPRKWMDSSRLNALGWRPNVALAAGSWLASCLR